MRATITLNEMRDQAGPLLFGNDWIGSLSVEEWALLSGQYAPMTQKRRSIGDGNPIVVDYIERCPRNLAPKLDRAIGRRARANAQYATVDSWLEDHGLPVDPVRPANRKIFRKIVQDASKPTKKLPESTRRGPKPKILDRIVQAMNNDIANGRLYPLSLETMPMKELEFRYHAKRERLTAAIKIVTGK